MSYSNGNVPTQGSHFSDGIRVGKLFAGSGNSNAVNNDNIHPLFPQYGSSDTPYGYSLGAPGIFMSPRYMYRIAPVAAVVPVSNCIVSTSGTNLVGPRYLATASVPGTTTNGIINGNNVIILDVPTALVATRLGSASAIVYVWGYDYGNVPMMEAINVGTALSANGLKAFKAISYVYVTQQDTWQLGTRGCYGLPYYIPDFGFLSSPCWDQTVLVPSNVIVGVTATPTATTGDVRGTITPPTAANGTKLLCVDMYVQGAQGENQTVAGLYGVPQYTQPLI